MRWFSVVALVALVAGCFDPTGTAPRADEPDVVAGAWVYDVEGYAPILSPVLSVPGDGKLLPSSTSVRFVVDGSLLGLNATLLAQPSWRIRVLVDQTPRGTLVVDDAGRATQVRTPMRAFPEWADEWVVAYFPPSGEWCFFGSALHGATPADAQRSIPLHDGRWLNFTLTWTGDGRYRAVEDAPARHPFVLEGRADEPCPTKAQGRSDPADVHDDRSFRASLVQRNADGWTQPAAGPVRQVAPPRVEATSPTRGPADGDWRDRSIFTLSEAVGAAMREPRLRAFLAEHERSVLTYAVYREMRSSITRDEFWTLQWESADDVVALTVTRTMYLDAQLPGNTTVNERKPVEADHPFAGWPEDGRVAPSPALASVAAAHASVTTLELDSMSFMVLRDGTSVTKVTSKVEACNIFCAVASTTWAGEAGQLITYSGPEPFFRY